MTPEQWWIEIVKQAPSLALLVYMWLKFLAHLTENDKAQKQIDKERIEREEVRDSVMKEIEETRHAALAKLSETCHQFQTEMLQKYNDLTLKVTEALARNMVMMERCEERMESCENYKPKTKRVNLPNA